MKFPIWDEFGYPVHERGVTAESGLYFLGQRWLHTIKSGWLYGIGNHAAYLAAHTADRLSLPNWTGPNW